MAESTWESRELRILESVAGRAQSAPVGPSSADVAADTGLSPLEVSLGLRALEDAEYVQGIRMRKEGLFLYVNLRLREAGLRAVGQWPRDSYDALVRIIEARLSQEQDPDRRSRLRALLDSLIGIGRDVAVNVLSEWAKSIRF